MLAERDLLKELDDLNQQLKDNESVFTVTNFYGGWRRQIELMNIKMLVLEHLLLIAYRMVQPQEVLPQEAPLSHLDESYLATLKLRAEAEQSDPQESELTIKARQHVEDKIKNNKH